MLKISSFGKITPVGLSQAKMAARESITEHESLLLQVCCMTHAEALDHMKTRDEGLEKMELQFLRAAWGPNNFGHQRKHGFLMEILMRCKNPLVIQLLIIAGVSLATGNSASATIVRAMVII